MPIFKLSAPKTVRLLSDRRDRKGQVYEGLYEI